MINDELISRKEVIDRLQKAQNVFLKHSPLEACGISYAREIIASEVEIPTIEKRPQRRCGMNNDKLNDAIKTIKELCEVQKACIECPMNCNCGTYPADWKETEGGAQMNGGEDHV